MTRNNEQAAHITINDTDLGKVVLCDKHFAQKTSKRQMILKLVKNNHASKFSRYHLIAKRLGDAGQALYAKKSNSVLVTDRILLAYAILIKIPFIVYSHSRNAENKFFKLSMFISTEKLTDELQLKNNQERLKKEHCEKLENIQIKEHLKG